MKFDCDYRKDRREAKRIASRQWHQWFAWYPVRLGPNDCRWLETIERRYTLHQGKAYHWDYMPGYVECEYRARP